MVALNCLRRVLDLCPVTSRNVFTSLGRVCTILLWFMGFLTPIQALSVLKPLKGRSSLATSSWRLAPGCFDGSRLSLKHILSLASGTHPPFTAPHPGNTRHLPCASPISQGLSSNSSVVRPLAHFSSKPWNLGVTVHFHSLRCH